MDEINEKVAKFIDFANGQDTGNGVKNLKLFSQVFFKEYRGLKVQFSVGKGRATFKRLQTNPTAQLCKNCTHVCGGTKQRICKLCGRVE